MNKLLTALRHVASYLLPIKRRVQSVHSGVVEVVLHEGRKVLDTAHANYSYGSLQRVLRYGLLFTEPAAPGPILVLGLGGGSVVETLRREHQATGPITAVELDPVLIQVADAEFGIRAGAGLDIVCADAFAWVPTAPTAEFRLVIIDLFIDLDLPAGLQAPAFWQHIWRLLQPGGYVLFNTLTKDSLVVAGQDVAAYLPTVGFAVKEVEVEQYNRLLVLHKATGNEGATFRG
ncbi:spermidine synthase [Hymenobacter sp. AT01-02]|uniref:spermidine synthase n=1 Tax=Hymenobacter sp. AT01-02 TaxID=1571877 RepID=UPI0005F1CF1B|nr:methyltransferase domain-containing protein [Hymenobacter sp. AT01-02]